MYVEKRAGAEMLDWGEYSSGTGKCQGAGYEEERLAQRRGGKKRADLKIGHYREKELA